MKNILIASLALLLAACGEQFLEPTPYGESTSAAFWRNASDAEAAINAAYEPLRDEEFYGHSEQTFETCSDDFWRAGDHGEDQAIEEFSFDPGNSQLRHSYTFKYEIISRANAVLINVPDIEMDQTLKNRILGEAYFLRAFAHWRLAVIYRNPVMITEDDVLAANYNKPGATRQELYDQIESDWQQAATLLPATQDAVNIGRPTSGTANGFLCKFYMYRANDDELRGTRPNTNDADLQLAIEYGNKVINGPYALAPAYNDNFTIATENNPEMLFAVQCLDGWAGADYRIYSSPRGAWGGWDFHEPVQDLVDEFEANDPRQDHTLLQPGEIVDLGGSQGPTEYTPGLSQTNYHFQKFVSWRASGGQDDGQNIPILRAADVYLLVAEAKIRLGQNGDAELNAVRTRAGLPALTGATIADLVHERRVELAGENQRHQDLMRWDRAGLIDIVAHYAEDRGQFKPSRTFVRPKHYFFALPQRDIDLSNGILKQDPNY
ncbi:MAG: RagB/SusD family nutrient uptake outer membrane protein [Bacteroidia bacterium]